MRKIRLQTEEQMESNQVAQTTSVFSAAASFMDSLTPKFARDARQIIREDGFRAVIKKYGWKFFAVFFAYYLVRDSIIYLLLPYLISRGLFF